jgi:hypothetical protein
MKYCSTTPPSTDPLYSTLLDLSRLIMQHILTVSHGSIWEAGRAGAGILKKGSHF